MSSAAVVTRAQLRLPAAALGADSPLPAFTSLQRLPDSSTSPGLPAEMRRRIDYGRLHSPLPYPVQSDYGRACSVVDLEALSLANDRMEVLVLPQYGGRVASIRLRAQGRDLLYRNPVLSFGNLGLTNAWFAGGIEWNLGSTGHSATTCRPVFAAAVDGPGGETLRLWEWERTRDLIFSVDLSLPEGSDFLVTSVRVTNPDPEDKPLYWWTNVAVTEEPGVRVLAPSARAWRTSYDGTLASVAMPHPDGIVADASYPATAGHAVDYFFQLEANRRKWIAAVGADGHGVVHTSTAPLTGRKLFCWGTGVSGARWQEWLSGPGHRYVEIQAGLAATQLEHLRLGADEEISWTEAIGPITVDPVVAHGDWDRAEGAVTTALGQLLSERQLDELHQRWRADVADRVPGEPLQRGSGFGLAELTLRRRPAHSYPGTPFSSPVHDGARHLLRLLRGGQVDPDQAVAELPIPPIGPAWQPVFASAASSWWVSLMRAIRAHATGDLSQARRHYQESLALRRSALALRGLALLDVAAGDRDGAADRYRAAVALEPDLRPLLVEATEALLAAGRAAECRTLIEDAPAAVARHGRIVLQRVRAMLALGDTGDAAALLEAGFDVPDIREGEFLDDVWRLALPEMPLPSRYDFRMTPPSAAHGEAGST